MPRLVPMYSSMLVAVSYNRETGQLIAQFPGGDKQVFYAYDGVTPEEAVDFMFDERSQGSAFDRIIKKGGKLYRRITADEALAG